VVVRWERPRRAITVNVVTGTRLSLLSSAAGRVFAAWLPRAQIDPLLLQELANEKKAPPGVHTLEDAHALLAEVEARGVAAITGNYTVKGVEALAAPVFNFKNELTMALIIVGVEGSVDMGPDSSVIAELKRAAESLSRRLGSTRNGEAPLAD